ncbi:glycosyltransferase involved in cell wall biosynthesis [Pseudomonas sp. BT76 TE3572]|uniref:Glycosyl transferase family 1 n=1 Tax=Pseudomonas mandelii PD30 TaxID=1419583 RepID=A0A059L5X2_9PSED|nr:glycosyltransferase family 4 protein [Pseudomonas mandelii]KDD69733.1 glycosyl transferase family 1 [Pseudomonas mandelii PD30]
MKVLLLSKYSRLGASSRLRFLQYIPSLEEGGVEVVVQCLFDDTYLKSLYSSGKRPVLRSVYCYLVRFFALFTVRKYDVIWIEKEVFPYFPATVERILRAFAPPYVVDYDDAIFHSYDLSSNSLIRKILGGKIDVVMRNAQCVIAGNNYLASRATAAGAKNVVVVPTVVDKNRYLAKRDASGQSLIIGWIGSPSTQKYVVAIRQTLLKVCNEFGARVLLMGATPEIVNELPGIAVEVRPWSEDSEVDFIRQIDVGIMPLVDGPWEKGKCGYKLIQYMASSVPVVASPVGVNIEIVDGNQCGLLADSLAEWESSLQTLLGDADQRLHYGRAGRVAVENKYTLHVQVLALNKIFGGVVGGRTSL